MVEVDEAGSTVEHDERFKEALESTEQRDWLADSNLHSFWMSLAGAEKLSLHGTSIAANMRSTA